MMVETAARPAESFILIWGLKGIASRPNLQTL